MTPRQDLFKTCNDPELRSQLESVMRAQRATSKQLHEARRNLHRAEEARLSHNYKNFPDERKRVADWIEREKGEVKKLEVTAAELVEQNNTIMAAMRSW